MANDEKRQPLDALKSDPANAVPTSSSRKDSEEQGWEHFPHDADIGIRAWGTTLAGAFEQAALAMMAIITDPSSIKPREMVHITCSAPDTETLLVDWLNQLILEMAVLGVLFARFDVKIDNGSLTATAFGEPIDVPRHQPAAEVKGATFTELQVRRENSGSWRVQCVLDV